MKNIGPALCLSGTKAMQLFICYFTCVILAAERQVGTKVTEDLNGVLNQGSSSEYSKEFKIAVINMKAFRPLVYIKS